MSLALAAPAWGDDERSFERSFERLKGFHDRALYKDGLRKLAAPI